MMRKEESVTKSDTSVGAYPHALAGFCAGFLSTVLLHPLDLIKVRLQVQNSLSKDLYCYHYSNTFQALKFIYKTEGFPGLYQGCTPNLLGSITAWSTYFFCYFYLKDLLLTKFDLSGTTQHALAAGGAGILALSLTNPIWVAKTRIYLRSYKRKPLYKNLLQTLISISKKEGASGLFKGYIPGLFNVSQGVIQFSVYERLKLFLLSSREPPLKFLDYIIMAATSKIAASLLTYPFQLARSRLQSQRNPSALYTGMKDCLSKTLKREGLRGLYKGLGSHVLRVTPAACITFATYETIFTLLETSKI